MSSERILITISYLFKMSCFLGVLYEIVIMSQLYFKYRVATQISVEINGTVTPYASTICTRYTDVLNYRRLERKTGRSWKDLTDGESVKNYAENLTIQEIFNNTPGPNKVVKSIQFRKAGSYKILTYSRMQAVRVTKFLYSEFVCYQVALNREYETTMAHSFLSVTTQSPGLVYEVKLTGKLNLAHYMKLASVPSEVLPRRSIRFQPVIRRGRRGTARIHSNFTPLFNYYLNTVSRIQSYFLPAPYETDCLDYRRVTPYRSEEVCKHTCMQEQVLDKLDRISFTIFVMKPHAKKMIVNADYMDKETERTFLEIQDYCDRIHCPKRDCRYRVSMTSTTALPDASFRVRMMVPMQPSIYKKTYPKTDFIEYFTFVSSTISTWIGISVLWFDPHNLIALFSTRMKKGKIKFKSIPEVKGKGRQRGDEEINLLIGGMAIMNRRIAHLEQSLMKLVKSLRKTLVW